MVCREENVSHSFYNSSARIYLATKRGVISCRFRSIQASYRVLMLNRYWFLHKVDPFFSNLPSSADWSCEWVDLHPFGGVWNPPAVVVCILILKMDYGRPHMKEKAKEAGPKLEGSASWHSRVTRGSDTGARDRFDLVSFAMHCCAVTFQPASQLSIWGVLSLRFRNNTFRHFQAIMNGLHILFSSMRWNEFISRLTRSTVTRAMEFKKNRPV